MTATAHALVAGAIYRAVPNPIVSIPLAFASHFMMDAVPHWDLGTNWRNRSKNRTAVYAIAETVLGITVAYLLFHGNTINPGLMATIVASELPDWMEAPWYIFFAHQNKHAPGPNAGILEKLTYKIYRLENFFHAKTGFPLGVITQVVVVSFFLILLQRA